MKGEEGMKKLVSFLLTFTMILSGAAMAYADEDLNSYTLDEIVEKAQEEGHVESVGMPDSWANWGDSWKGLTDTYGIEHSDEDMSSAEELSMFQNDKQKSFKLTKDNWKTFRTRWQRFRGWFAHLLAPFL